METPLSYLDKLQKQGNVSKNEYELIQSEIKRVVTLNQNAEKNKLEKRW